jgi:4-amino-4-deoxy-L-arabinose transferase-like glycosyltransferase
MPSRGSRLALVAASCVAVRAILWLGYGPLFGHDTYIYQDIALQFRNWDFSLYCGVRPPVFPAFLLLTGLDYTWLVLAQQALGVLSAVFLFDAARRLTGSVWLALIAAIGSGLALNLVLVEFCAVPEALSSFLVVCSFWLLVRIRDAAQSAAVFCLLLGLAMALAGLARPNLFVLIPVYAVFLVLPRFLKATRKVAVIRLAAYAVPCALLILGWCAFNKRQIGCFTPTTATGYHLTQHVGAFMEDAPAEFATVRDVYLKYRERFIAGSGSHAGTIWRAFPEMQEKTGLSFAQLSSELTRLSLRLCVRHPVRYLMSVASSWAHFWTAPAIWSPPDAAPWLAAALKRLLAIQRPLWIAVNAAFLGLAALTIGPALVRRRPIFADSCLICLLGVVLSASVFQALAEVGENGKFSLPFQPLVILAVLIGCRELAARFREPLDGRSRWSRLFPLGRILHTRPPVGRGSW